MKEELIQIQYCPYDDKCGKLYDCSKEEYETMAQSNMKLSLENQQLKSILEEIKKLVESYNLGKYDYSIPPGGIIDLLQIIYKSTKKED